MRTLVGGNITASEDTKRGTMCIDHTSQRGPLLASPLMLLCSTPDGHFGKQVLFFSWAEVSGPENVIGGPAETGSWVCISGQPCLSGDERSLQLLLCRSEAVADNPSPRKSQRFISRY